MTKLIEIRRSIQRTFGLNYDQLVKACRDDSEEFHRRVFDLNLAAEAWRNAGFEPEEDPEEWLPHGCSLLGLLCLDDINIDAILFLGDRLQTFKERRELKDPFEDKQ